MPFDTARAKSLVWAIPAAVVILLVKTSMHTGVVVPAPFLLIFVMVVIAGAGGGGWAGLLASLMTSAFVVDAHLNQFGPPTLTGSIGVVAIGTGMVLLTGVLLGRLKDQRDWALRDLQAQRDRLANELRSETAEKMISKAEQLSSEARLQNAVRIAGIGHFSFCAFTGDCVFCSDEHAAHFGMTPKEFCALASGTGPQLDFVHADDRERVAATTAQFNSGESKVFEYRALRPDGEVRYIREMEDHVHDRSGKHIETLRTSIDLTDLRRAEIRLRQSQKIESLGRLTGGVAHDFNNLSAVVLGNIELALEQGPTDDWKDLLNEAVDAIKRGAALTKNLLSFSRRAYLKPAQMNLNPTVRSITTWADRELPASITLKTTLSDDLWDVELDSSAAEDACVNILLNAADAMPGGGRITIETANQHLRQDAFEERDGDSEPGRYVMIAISDTGKGIPEDTLDAIFEPFFTEKPIAQGAGLGLSMVQGFVKQSGGMIRVQSELGVGTTFKLYFRAMS